MDKRNFGDEDDAFEEIIGFWFGGFSLRIDFGGLWRNTTHRNGRSTN
ncbi:hypothetical protein [Candidatus Leptofilum sp.]